MSDAPTFSLSVPGRLCLFGEHSDWAGEYRRINPAIAKGRCLVVGTAGHEVHARVSVRSDARLLYVFGDGEDKRTLDTPMEVESLRKIAAKGGFFGYVAGTASVLMERFGLAVRGGLSVHNHETTLPIGKGLSSSAAVCVLVARAFSRAYGLHLTTEEEMDVAYHGEVATPSRCGRMDQCSAFGCVPICMEFDGVDVKLTPLQLIEPLHILVVDLGAEKNTLRILNDLHHHFPLDEPDSTTSPGARLRDLLGPINLEITAHAMRLLRAPDSAQHLGTLMTHAQERFDSFAMPLCPEELTAPQLHRLLQHPPLQPLIWGGKGVGSGGDGSGQLLCRSREAMVAAQGIIKRDLGMNCTSVVMEPNVS